jgi:AcrR family transcriptional regulator
MLSFVNSALYTDYVSGVRARVRAEMTDEIKRQARLQVDAAGASSLSLRAISRDMGTACSALYRYFPSRDHLLTVLIIENYDALGAVVEAADAAVPREDLAGRWRAAAGALRRWAIENPADYGLNFGTPVPGYEAPEDTIGPGTRYTNTLLSLLADIHAAGCTTRVTMPRSPQLRREYRAIRKRSGVGVPDELLLAGLTAWMGVIGAVSVEVFGHLRNVLDEPSAHFDAMVSMIGHELLGLPR